MYFFNTNPIIKYLNRNLVEIGEKVDSADITQIKCIIHFTFYVKYTILFIGSDEMKTKIKELRKINKVSQDELAMEVGVTRQTIISLEKEKYTASLVLAYKIAKYFHLTIEDVFDFSDVEDINNERI